MREMPVDYLWRYAPDWATFIAQDSDGVWNWYERKPHARIDEGVWYAYGRHEPAAFHRPSWAKTLGERPLIRTPKVEVA